MKLASSYITLLIGISVCIYADVPNQYRNPDNYLAQVMQPLNMAERKSLNAWLHSERSRVPGCSIEVVHMNGSVYRVKFSNTIKQDISEISDQRYINKQKIMFDDLLFSTKRHPEVPVGISVLFLTENAVLYGFSDELNYSYGWTPRILSAEISFIGKNLRYLSPNESVTRKINISKLLEDFQWLFGKKNPERGCYYVIFRMPLLGIVDRNTEQIDCLYSVVKIPGTL